MRHPASRPWRLLRRIIHDGRQWPLYQKCDATFLSLLGEVWTRPRCWHEAPKRSRILSIISSRIMRLDQKLMHPRMVVDAIAGDSRELVTLLDSILWERKTKFTRYTSTYGTRVIIYSWTREKENSPPGERLGNYHHTCIRYGDYKCEMREHQHHVHRMQTEAIVGMPMISEKARSVRTSVDNSDPGHELLPSE